MARPLRIEYAGALYHVTSRGDRREDIYVDDEDRLIWLDIFAQVCSRFNWRCHAWCLMDNHYHIVIETIEGNLSQGMRQLNGVFTQKSNRRHGRVGHVFQGRYKAILVQKDAHLLELTRYVVLNPIRAGVVSDLLDWRWSSYLAMVNETPCPQWLEIDWVLAHFGKPRETAVLNYKNFVREGVGLPPVWNALKRQVFLGDDMFIDKAMGEMECASGQGDIKEVPRMQRRAPAKSLDWYVDNYPSRHEAIFNAFISGDFSMKAIADYFEVHYSTVSRIVKKEER
ncbi:MAG: transposase [Cycloclasticus sp.]|nr:transposase [Cycloclasticus sp.]